MISYVRIKWIAVFYFLVIPSVDPQMAMYPMFPPPPVQIAVPMPIPMPIMIREPDESSQTDTATTERNRVGIPFPLAIPMAIPMPAMRMPRRPRPRPRPRPPPDMESDRYDDAMPVPPMFAPPPVVVVPFPSSRRPRRPYRPSSFSDCADTESADDDSCSYSNERRNKRRRKLGHMKRRPKYRRNFESMEIRDNELVKPVLTYVSQDGDVKLKRQLSNDEAAELTNDKPYQRIRLTVGEDDGNMQRVLITSKNERNLVKTGDKYQRRQVVLSPGSAQHVLREGKKELVFRPPGGKTISNLSVSFQISE